MVKTNSKTKRHIVLWVVIILSLAIAEYYLINKYVDEDTHGKVIEDRTLTTNEQDFFEEYFLDNPGFVRNFYDEPADLSISMILDMGQGIDKIKTLSTKEKLNIIESDFQNNENYTYLYANPETAFNIIIDASLMRDLYNEKTGDKYNNTKKTTHWTYNQAYDIYYNAIPYGNEDSYPNYYTFSNIKITDNSVYNIAYTAYYKPTIDSPDYTPNYKEELYSGILTIKKTTATQYHFISNVLTEHLAYINTMLNYNINYDFNNIIKTTDITTDKDYYNDSKTHKINISKYNSVNELSTAYALKITPVAAELYEETYYFDNFGDLSMYVIHYPDGLATYYYFVNDIIDAKYEVLNNNEFSFKAYTETIKTESEFILENIDKINILN